MIPLIEQQRETGAGLSLAAMCRVLEVSRAGLLGVTSRNGNNRTLRPSERR